MLKPEFYLAIAALGAALITALMTLLGLIISKEQKISVFRQAWIDSLRSDFSNLIAYTLIAYDSGYIANSTTKTDAEIKVSQSAANIRLRLNPNEADAKAILDLLDEMRVLISTSKNPSLIKEIDKIINAVRKLQKKEWNRVKKGELTYRTTKFIAALTFISVPIIFFFLFFWLN